MVLFYLDKLNHSYIVHPTNHFEDYISKPLERFGKIQENNIEKLLVEKPEVVICNTMRIHRGFQLITITLDVTMNTIQIVILKLILLFIEKI